MWQRRTRTLFTIAILSTGALAVVATYGFLHLATKEDPRLAYKALDQIRDASLTKDGFWVADVAGLYERGRIPREIAEADAAPLVALIERPRPYHGYLFVALESFPTGDALGARERSKGENFDQDCAFCAYPAERGSNKRVFLITNGGHFYKTMEGGIPILKWPIDFRKIESGWHIMD